MIIEINGQFYESGGSHGAWGGGGGVEKIGTPSATYLAQFPNVLHPAGLYEPRLRPTGAAHGDRPGRTPTAGSPWRGDRRT